MAGNIKLRVVMDAHPAEIIRIALLPMTLSGFAEKYGWAKAEVTHCLRGHRRGEKVRDALAKELHVSRAEIDLLLDGYHKQKAA